MYFTSYVVFSIAVLPHSPGVVYYHLLLRRETRFPGVAPFSFRRGIWDLFVYRGQKSYTPTAFWKLWTTRGVRDWSLITGRGGLQNGKIAGPKLFAPPPQDRVKLFEPPLLKSWKFSWPPYNMVKTSSYRLKSTPKLFVPPLQHG